MFFVPFRREGRDAIGGEFARHVLNGELIVGKLELVGHVSASMMASASISTFHSGRISAGTTSIVNAGRTFLNADPRSEEHTSELQSLMRLSYAAFCLKKKRKLNRTTVTTTTE